MNWRNRGLPILVLAALAAHSGTLHAEEFELLDGSTIVGSYRSVTAEKIVLESQDGATLEIPLNYLTPHQQYEARKWRLKPEDLDPNDPNNHMNLGMWCFLHRHWDARLEEYAKTEFARAETQGGDEFTSQIMAFLLGNNIMVGEDGRWMDADDWHKAQGHVWDPVRKKWLTKKEKARLDAEADQQLKTQSLLPDTGAYRRVFLDILANHLSVFADRNKKDKYRKIRFWSGFLALDTDFVKVAAQTLQPLSSERFVRLLVVHEDSPDLYIEKKQYDGKVVKKAGLMARREVMQVFGRVYLTDKGYIIIVDDLLGG